jgi:hypothetical protein
LFYCSCSDLDNLAAFSSPSENDFLSYLSLLIFGFGLDILAKFAKILAVKRLNIKIYLWLFYI